jgi:hypothetical protein
MSGPSGAVARLVTKGAQDVFLTGGKPDISFFNSTLYKRHTNFSQFQQEQVIEGNPVAGGTSMVNFKRSGDLLSYCFITVTQSNQTQLIDTWSNVISKAEFYIGEQLVDTQDSNFSEELAVDLFADSMSKSYLASLHGGLGSESYFYPFRFFFCEKWASSLPIVGLHYSDIRLKLTWSSNLNSNYSIKFYANYIALDEIERRHFATKPLQMLIYQVQKQEASNTKAMELYFNNPVKFICSSNASSNNALVSINNTAKLQVNGVDMTDDVLTIPFFTAVPSYYHTDFSVSNAENMFFYPFCLHASRFQPSGTLNFSRLDSFRILCSQPINRDIYAVNYNILKIENGIGGVMYAN